MTPEFVQTLCHLAGFDVRDDDLTALADAFEGHLEAVRSLRRLPGVTPDLDGSGLAPSFDPRWT